MQLYFILISTAVTAQHRQAGKNNIYFTTISKSQIAPYIDSLRKVIISDTAKFKMSDLKKRDDETINKAGYSKLFIVDNKYYYKLDVISGAKVEEFLNTYFSPDSIEEITDYHHQIGAAAIYGWRAVHGAVLIKIKDGVIYNPNVAGLDSNVKPNNFNQNL